MQPMLAGRRVIFHTGQWLQAEKCCKEQEMAKGDVLSAKRSAMNGDGNNFWSNVLQHFPVNTGEKGEIAK